MAKIIWDESGKRKFEAGVQRGVLYPVDSSNKYSKGVAWNGLTGVTESPEGADATDLWADGIKYATMRSAENFKGTIEAYTYPDEFAECDGTAQLVDGVTIGQQPRKGFGFAYRTELGDDVNGLGNEDNYLLHLIYGCTASVSQKAYTTINDSPSAITFSWEITTTPVNVSGHKATSRLIIDSTKIDKTKLKKIEDAIYGTDSTEAYLPLPDEILALIK